MFTGVASKISDPGKYKTHSQVTYIGTLKFWGDNSAIAYDPINPTAHLITNVYGNNSACNTRSASAVQPDLLGTFPII